MSTGTLSRVGFLCGLLAALTCAVAEDGLKQVEVGYQLRTAPVVITGVSYRGTRVPCGLLVNAGIGVPPVVQAVTPFFAGDDWLQQLTISLYNQTDKTVTQMSLALFFPETGEGTHDSPIRVGQISLGRLPDGVAKSIETHQPIQQDERIRPISFAPHQTVLIDLGAEIDRMKGALDNLPFRAITKCTIRMSSAFLDDKMKWTGSYWTPDANSPGGYKAMEKAYFPGPANHPWPPAAAQ